jgi:hypothetical protein
MLLDRASAAPLCSVSTAGIAATPRRSNVRRDIERGAAPSETFALRSEISFRAMLLYPLPMMADLENPLHRFCGVMIPDRLCGRSFSNRSTQTDA